MKLYGDSKKLEALEGKAETLLYEYGELAAEKDLVFEELGIIKTPTYVCVKGKIVLYFTKKLTENNQKRLKKMLNSEFDDVIRYMLKNNCKLEQEAIDTQRGLV